MPAQTVYSGPGKVYAAVAGSNYAMQADGENGTIEIALDEQSTVRGTAMHGAQRETLDNQQAILRVTPFDSWALLPALFPPHLGVTTASTTAALAIGTRPHDYAAGSASGNAAVKVWTQDGRLYNFVRGAITKHPSLKLGVGQSLFDQVEFALIGDAAKNPGDSSFMLAGNAITESAASDPDSTGFSPDFINGKWTGAYGAVTGFTAMEPEDFWTLTAEVKYSPLTIQKLVRHYKLDSVRFMVKARLVGPTHTQLAARLLGHTLGATIAPGSATDLVLSGPSSKTVTLKNCEPKGAGFEFGGTKLGTGEVGFVSTMTFSAGAPGALLVFN